MQPLVCCSSDR